MKRSVLTVLVGGFLAAGLGQAHVPSTAQIILSVQGRHLAGHWDVALRDIDHALSLDANEDGKITWGEVKAHAAELAAYCRSHLTLQVGAEPVTLECGVLQIDRRSDGVYAVISLSAELPSASPALRIDYDAFFVLDPLHRGVLRFECGGASHRAVFGPETLSQVVSAIPTKERN